MSLTETIELAKILAQSGFFSDARQAAQVVVKVLAGRELGFGPIASMTGVNIIKGRVSLAANMMAQAVKRSARYDYRTVKLTPDVCEIAFSEEGKDIGHSIFTKEDAAKAGTKNMSTYPRNMLFARAMSNGVRWYCPDTFETGVYRWYCPDASESGVYTPEELGAEVNAEGEEIVDGEEIIEEDQSPQTLEEAKEALATLAVAKGHMRSTKDGERAQVMLAAAKAHGLNSGDMLAKYEEWIGFVTNWDGELPEVLNEEDIQAGRNAIAAPVPDAKGEPKPPPPDVEAKPKTHWIDRSYVGPNGEAKPMRARFWAWAGSQGLSNDDVHKAIGQEHIREFAGTMQDAKVIILAWVADRIKNQIADEAKPETVQADYEPFEF